MTTLAPSLLIGPFLYLQVTRITMKFRIGSKFGKIRPGTEELAALKRMKNPQSLIMEEYCDPSSAFIFWMDLLHSCW